MKIQDAKSIIFKRLAPSCIALIGVVLGVSASTSSHAALIQITSIDGITFGVPNGGLVNGGAADITLVPGGGTATLRNNAYDQTGFMQKSYRAPMNYGFYYTIPEQLALEFALASDNYASPRQFTLGQSIDSSSLWTYGADENSEFKTTTYPMSPNFGLNTYMGFRSGGGAAGYNYGYLEVTWARASETFTILGGAYESDYNVGITAGAISAAVPEPGQVAASLLLLSGIGGYIFLKRRKAAKPAVAPTAA